MLAAWISPAPVPRSRKSCSVDPPALASKGLSCHTFSPSVESEGGRDERTAGMALPQHFMDELRRRTVLSSIIGRRTTLTKRAGRLVGLCPFHNEKTPSFHVRDDEGYYHCFGCGVSGDAISFLREKEGLGFMEAVQLLADMAGMQVPQSTPQDPAANARRDARFAVLDDAARFFQSALAQDNGTVTAYLNSRGLDRAACEMYRLGYAPRNGLMDALKKAGHSPEIMMEAGIARKSDRDGSIYPYFRHRLIFPIMDMRGRVIAFGGRALEDDQQPKYLNSPENPMFQKKTVLYNGHLVRPLVRGGLPLLVTEGYMDAIAVQRSGLAAAVAPLGTALTEEQIGLLWRIDDQPVLCFDGDRAGKAAELKAILRALPLLEPGKSLRLLALPAGCDPDDVLRQQGKDVFAAMLARTLSLVDGLWDGLSAGVKMDDATARAGFWQEIRQHVRQIDNGQMRAAIGDEVEHRIGVMRQALRGTGQSGYGRGSYGAPGLAVRRPTLVPDKRGRLILALLVEHPALIEEYYEQVALLSFRDEMMENLRQTVINAVNRTAKLDELVFRQHLEEYGFGNIKGGFLLEGMGARLRYDPATVSIDQARNMLAEALKIEARTHAGKTRAPLGTQGD